MRLAAHSARRIETIHVSVITGRCAPGERRRRGARFVISLSLSLSLSLSTLRGPRAKVGGQKSKNTRDELGERGSITHLFHKLVHFLVGDELLLLEPRDESILVDATHGRFALRVVRVTLGAAAMVRRCGRRTTMGGGGCWEAGEDAKER